MWCVVFSVFIVLAGATSRLIEDDYPRSNIWALLVAGSNGYGNYRHQADVCHAYQILHRNGIPDENIIVMMYDDIANDQDNPTPGVIINYPGGPNVYEGVQKDYTGKDVKSENFLNILSGNKTAMKGIGSGKVIESGPNDVIFVNFVDHGGPGVLYFPNDDLLADTLLKTVSQMAMNSKFSKLIFYVEACHSGSMFDNLLPDTTDVFVLTAADPFESSYACYFDDKRETYLGDVFSIMWMNDTEHESLPEESLHHQFERVRTATNTSHVEEYGDLDIGTTKLKDVIGFRMRERLVTNTKRPNIPGKMMDVVDNIDVPMSLLEKKIAKEENPMKKRKLKLEMAHFIKRRLFVDNIFREILEQITEASRQKMDELRSSQYGLNWNNFDCYKQLYRTFNKACVNAVQSPYVRIHFQKLINMCSVSWLTTSEALHAVNDVCRSMISSSLSRQMMRIY